MQTKCKVPEHVIDNQKIGHEPVISNFAVVFDLKVILKHLGTLRILQSCSIVYFLPYTLSFRGEEKTELKIFIILQWDNFLLK